jgi:hypothetical protein
MNNNNHHPIFDKANDTSIMGEAEESRLAEESAEQVFGDGDNAVKTGELISHFVASYERHKDEQSLEEWLAGEFRQYSGIWKDEDEIVSTAREIVLSVQENNANKESLYAHLDAGKSKASWLADKIEQGAKAAGVTHVGAYAARIDDALKTATEAMWEKITVQSGHRRRGEISEAFNLDGFIAERHHADTFNIDAVSQGSEYHAKVLNSNSKNSVDIAIYDGKGNEVRRYQCKYGADADKTRMLLEKGDYQDQISLVPSEQAGQIEGATDVIEIDGIKSKPLSKAEAKEMQRQAQIEAEAREYVWNDVNRINIAKQIGKQALIGASLAVGFQGVRILGRRVWNKIQGRDNPSASEDLREFFQSSLKSGAHVGVQVAVTGAIVVAVKNGLIKVLQSTPAGQIANMVYVGMENAKVLFKLAKGEVNGIEALDAMGNATCCAIGGLWGGAMAGAAFGGPIGIFVGAVVGGMAGSAIGEAAYKGVKAIGRTAIQVIESIWESTKEKAEIFAKAMNPLRLRA